MTVRRLLALTAVLIGASNGGSQGLPLSTSFETGSERPDGWHSAASGKVRGEWLSGTARRGQRSIGGESRRARVAWEGGRVPVPPREGRIAEAWIKPDTGSGRLVVALYDDAGKALGQIESPWVDGARDWTYVAVDTASAGDRFESAAFLEPQFHVRKGRALLDDFNLTPSSPAGMANPDFEAALDKKGRIPFWDVEEKDTATPGKRDGSVTLIPSGASPTGQCAEVSVAGDWFGITSIHYNVPCWTDRPEFRVMARCGAGAQVQILTVWTDSAGEILRVDAGPVEQPQEWLTIGTGPLAPPEKAMNMRPILVARRAGQGSEPVKAWFDNTDLYSLPPNKATLKVLVNQVGYPLLGPKSIVVMSNFPPEDAEPGRVEIVDEKGATAGTTALVCRGRMYGGKDADWGWYFWRADFTPFQTPGRYTARAAVGGQKAGSYPFVIGQDVLFQETTPMGVDFFHVQRCGGEVAGWHGLCHMDDAKMPDGSHRDLTGGWHSAGDYNKIVYEYGDGGAMYALVGAAEAAPDLAARFDRDKDGLPDILDEAWWGAKFMVKAQLEETGGLVNNIEQGPDRKTWMNWVRPEHTTDNTPGTPDDPIVREGEGQSPLAIGGWARLGRILEQRGTPNDYVDRAVRLWEHATIGGTGGPNPLLLVATLDLYRVRPDERFLTYAQRSVEGLLASGDPKGALPGGNAGSGDLPAAALAYFALERPDNPLRPRIWERLQAHLPYFIADGDNPLGICKLKLDPDGYFFDPASTLGTNNQFFARAWAALLMYRLLDDPRAYEYAMDQINFVFGVNPIALCMMEGLGSNNPPRYHHRYIGIPGKEDGAVPGAIPNGFVRDVAGFDRPGFDLSTGGRAYPSYRTSEPWLVHNVLCLLAMEALHEAEEYAAVPRP